MFVIVNQVSYIQSRLQHSVSVDAGQLERGWDGAKDHEKEGSRKRAPWRAPRSFQGDLRRRASSASFKSSSGPFRLGVVWADQHQVLPSPGRTPHLTKRSLDTSFVGRELGMEHRKSMRHYPALPMVVKVTRASGFLVTTPPKIASIGASRRTASCLPVIFYTVLRRQGGPLAQSKVRDKVTRSLHSCCPSDLYRGGAKPYDPQFSEEKTGSDDSQVSERNRKI